MVYVERVTFVAGSKGHLLWLHFSLHGAAVWLKHETVSNAYLCFCHKLHSNSLLFEVLPHQDSMKLQLEKP